MLIKSTILKIRNKSKERVMNKVAIAMKGHTRFIIKSFSVKTEVYMRTREERKKKKMRALTFPVVIGQSVHLNIFLRQTDVFRKVASQLCDILLTACCNSTCDFVSCNREHQNKSIKQCSFKNCREKERGHYYYRESKEMENKIKKESKRSMTINQLSPLNRYIFTTLTQTHYTHADSFIVEYIHPVVCLSVFKKNEHWILSSGLI